MSWCRAECPRDISTVDKEQLDEVDNENDPSECWQVGFAARALARDS